MSPSKGPALSKSSPKIYALHGFLGLPSDWDGFNVEAIRIRAAPSMEDWAKEFNRQVREQGGKHFLMGYSMGGRLALHALIDAPELWEKAFLLSTHPGLIEGKDARMLADEEWARRFESEPFDVVVGDWMRQPVFKGTATPVRHESDFNKKELSSQLRQFSLAKQAKLSSDKAEWYVGERDQKLRALLPEATIVPNAGHRILLDNPELIKKRILAIYSLL